MRPISPERTLLSLPDEGGAPEPGADTEAPVPIELLATPVAEPDLEAASGHGAMGPAPLPRPRRALVLMVVLAALTLYYVSAAPLPFVGTIAAWLAPLRQCEWVVYAKRPFAGPAAVLTYLSLYTHRVAISNSRLLAMDERGVSFRWKDYRTGKPKIMTLDAHEFMRRFLLHVLPKGFRRIRHFGFFANACRTTKLAAIRTALKVPEPQATVKHDDYRERYEALTGRRLDVCPDCGGTMVLIGLLYTAPASWDTS